MQLIQEKRRILVSLESLIGLKDEECNPCISVSIFPPSSDAASETGVFDRCTNILFDLTTAKYKFNFQMPQSEEAFLLLELYDHSKWKIYKTLLGLIVLPLSGLTERVGSTSTGFRKMSTLAFENQEEESWIWRELLRRRHFDLTARRHVRKLCKMSSEERFSILPSHHRWITSDSEQPDNKTGNTSTFYKDAIAS